MKEAGEAGEAGEKKSMALKRVGVIGGGQLAWMMAAAATKLGLELVVQTPSSDDPAVSVAAGVILAAIDDATATAQLAAQCDVITFENEFVNLAALSNLAEGVFRPSLETLKPLLDKYDQRCYLRDLGLPTPQFAAWDATRLLEARDRPVLTAPIVLKTRRHGYDGQGTLIVDKAGALDAALEQLGSDALLVEAFVPFERELAVIAARSITGEIVLYPIVETQQRQQVCHRVFAPANVSRAIAAEVEAIVQTLLNSLQAVGVFGIEFFLTADDKVWVNEIAPRTHNSGHFTLDACETSQFEQQLRSVCGLPLGSPAMQAPGAVMVNLLGYEQSQSDYQAKRQQLAAIPNAHLHWYAKTESRPGRKLGHITVLLADGQPGTAIADAVEAIWYSR